MGFLDDAFDDYDPSNEPAGGNFNSIPAGWYDARVAECELIEKSSAHHMVKMRFDITGPSHEGRVMFNYFNIKHPNEQAAKFAKRDIQSCAFALGLKAPIQTSDFVGGQLSIKVKKTKARDPQYGDDNGEQNQVAGFKAMGGGSAMPKPAASNSGAAPWER